VRGEQAIRDVELAQRGRAQGVVALSVLKAAPAVEKVGLLCESPAVASHPVQGGGDADAVGATDGE